MPRNWSLQRITAAALAGVLWTGLANAQANRLGVLLPEQAQLQQAVQAAARLVDPPLELPLEEAVNPDDLVIVEEEEPSEIEEAVAEALDPISLEERIQNQVLQTELYQFGYEIFSDAPSTFAPVEGIPVPTDYLIGPGDTFVLKIYGAVDVEYRLVVTREGQLLIPEIGELQLAGLTFDEAKTVIQDEVADSRVGARSVVTLAELHSIHVLMVGEVTRPGSYTVSGLSSLLNTLITTGGIKRTGSLRNIQVRRAGQLVATMDLYELLLKGTDDGNIYLRQGDVVFVPPVNKTIGVAGEVYRPAIFELKDEQTIGDVLTLAGGLTPKAAPAKSHIERITEQETRTLVSIDISSADGQATSIRNGDILRVFPVLNKMDNVVTLSGHVLEPGGYQWFEGMRVSDLIRSRSNLRQSIDLSTGLIQREIESDKSIDIRYFNLGAVLDSPGSDLDPLLSPRDQVLVFDIANSREPLLSEINRKLTDQAEFDRPQLVEFKSHVRLPGTYPLQRNTRLLDMLRYSGGLKAGTDLHYALLVRTEPNSRDISVHHIELARAHEPGRDDDNPYLEPMDRVYIFARETPRADALAAEIEKLRAQATAEQAARIVSVGGAARAPGTYPLTAGMRLNQLVEASGGLLESASQMTAVLSRRVPLPSADYLTDHLEVRLSGTDNDLDLILEPYDHLVLRTKPEWDNQPRRVVLRGEVKHPGEYQVDKRETLCGLVNRAGGFTEDAYLFGSVFTRESVREREQKALNSIFDNLDDLIVDVHMSPGYEKDMKLPVTQSATDSLRVLKQLERHKAVGRLVIDLEKVMDNCYAGADIVLEPGDELIVPKYRDEVSVVGQVYFPSSHLYRQDRAALDYVNLSGGVKELANRNHIYIAQANGEVVTVRSSSQPLGFGPAPSNLAVTPGSTIYVPISVDRINGREFTQSWIDSLFKLGITAASLDYIFD